ncbi:MAG: sigma-70 family RNA polymerase sigma factor [Muricauda sp. TMED12]|nr:MAG: sigma-70 family RNA polymerase sigma factor [Muricauda sp. TMED12]
MDKTYEDRLIEIAWRDTEQDLLQAEKSFAQFIAKYGSFCRKLAFARSRYDSNRYEDLYRLLILDIWEHAHQYDDTRSPDDIPDVRIKKWLSSRMKAVERTYWKELFKDNKTLSLEELTAETFEPEQEDDEILGDDEIDVKRLKIAMVKGKLLTDRELDILRTSYQYNGEIPKEIKASICKQYLITDNTIRVIKFRALKKIKEFIAQKPLSTK